MSEPRPGIADELSFSVDLASLEASPMPDVSLSTVGIHERGDLQRWIEAFPEIVERDLLLVTTEFDQWQIRDQRVSDRLDVLFLDTNGSLLVAELKRDDAPDTTELQALKYAAYCSQLTVDDVVEQYARYHELDLEEARGAILEQAPNLEDRELGPIRVRLVAGGFGPSVTHVTLWLRDLGLDIGCIQIRARRHGTTHAVLTTRQLIPPPAASEYLVKRRRREVEEEQREASARRRNTIVVLAEAGLIKPGDELKLDPTLFSDRSRSGLEAKIAENPAYAIARYTGEGLRTAFEWALDGKKYSCSGLTWTMLDELGLNPGSIAGPDYWRLSDGRTLYAASCEIEDPQRPADRDGKGVGSSESDLADAAVTATT